jgi:hypothetical protein
LGWDREHWPACPDKSEAYDIGRKSGGDAGVLGNREKTPRTRSYRAVKLAESDMRQTAEMGSD